MALPDVGPLALGCAPLGNLYRPTTDDAARATVAAAWDAGVRLFDTAPLYGHGLSESRTGAALRGRPRDGYLLSTKVGRLLVPDPGGAAARDGIFADVPHLRPEPDFTRDGVLRSIEASLDRLGLDRVDVVHLHDPDDHLDQARREAHPALLELRDQGVIRAIGVGTNWAHVAAAFVGQVDVDAVLLAGRHTLLEQTGTPELFARCADLGITVIAAGVLNSGILADPRPGAPYDYVPASPAQVARAQRLAAVCERHGVPLVAAALQYPLRHPAVSVVLVGAGTADEVSNDRRLLDVDIPEACWAALEREGVPVTW
jgi:D-threo-aldose 1-dehydrogenase